MMKTFTHFIDGQSVGQPGPRKLTSLGPTNGKPVAEIPLGDADIVEQAVISNLAAYEEWRDMAPLVRGRLLIDLGRKIRASIEQLSTLEIEQTGKLSAQTLIEIEAAAQYFEYYGGLTTLPIGEVIDNGPGYHAYTARVPFGVVGVITPWNLPMNQSARAIAPALAIGNVVTCKPSEYTSGTAIELAKMAVECGIPKGVLNVVLGTGPECGKALVSHPKVSKVCFTGSVRAGQEIGHVAAERIIPLTLELGGKSANIIFEDANLDEAITSSVSAFVTNAGQVCTAGTRLLVQRSIYDTVVTKMVEAAKLVKVGKGDGASVGAITTKDQLDRIYSYFDVADQDGAKLELGGRASHDDDWGEGRFAPITIYSDVTSDMRIAQEEIFGPVLSIIGFDSEEEAIEIANGTEYGLAAGLWTQNLSRAHRVALALEAGYTSVNHYHPSIFLPLGGFKKSGYGREKGIEALHHYGQVKSINIKL